MPESGQHTLGRHRRRPRAQRSGMKILLVGVGGVGEAIAVIAQDRPWLETMVLSDINVDRAMRSGDACATRTGSRSSAIDATDRAMIAELARKYDVDLVMNAVEPLFNEQIFDAAFDAGCTYMDMAMTLSTPHPDDPLHRPASSSATTSSSAPTPGRRRGCSRSWAWAWSPGSPTSSRATPRSTCSTGSTRSGSATARTSRSAATSSRRTSRSGRRSRSASTRP